MGSQTAAGSVLRQPQSSLFSWWMASCLKPAQVEGFMLTNEVNGHGTTHDQRNWEPVLSNAPPLYP